ncbi:hypothetical protein [Flavobacterium sp.]|uniref:hypothetical protein n=1 Tax=Flavobacterium sp. TaxID=239 RepID=UPI00286D963C|nr:hypothetical protein [Flavobacterium sp.]
MVKKLQNSMLKCIDSKNTDGITFLEVVMVGMVFPFVIKKAEETFISILKN